MELIKILKDIPKERIRQDKEIKEVYDYLKEVFAGDFSPAINTTDKGGIPIE